MLIYQRLYYMHTAHVLHLLDQVNDNFKKCKIDYRIMRSTEYWAEWESLSYIKNYKNLCLEYSVTASENNYMWNHSNPMRNTPILCSDTHTVHIWGENLKALLKYMNCTSHLQDSCKKPVLTLLANYTKIFDLQQLFMNASSHCNTDS